MTKITKKQALIWIEEELSCIQYTINTIYKNIGSQSDIKDILFRIEKIQKIAKNINDQLSNFNIKEGL